jgi:hypothetical protein
VPDGVQTLAKTWVDAHHHSGQLQCNVPFAGARIDMSDRRSRLANKKVARQTGEQKDAGIQADHGASGFKNPDAAGGRI